MTDAATRRQRYQNDPALRAIRSATTKRWRLKPENRKRLATYRNKRLARRRVEHRAILDALKIERGCIDCGYRENPIALEFDHVRGVKTFTISMKVGHLNLKRLLIEIEKCDVRCANCHRIREVLAKRARTWV